MHFRLKELINVGRAECIYQVEIYEVLSPSIPFALLRWFGRVHSAFFIKTKLVSFSFLPSNQIFQNNE